MLQWELGIISSLLDEITLLESKWIPAIKARRSFALTLREQSIDKHKSQWALAIQSIKEHPMYDGLIIEPQLGLIPLHQDPTSGLWEFAHLQSGTSRRGRKIYSHPQTSIVLTLLPASSFWMGATKGVSQHRSALQRYRRSCSFSGDWSLFHSKYEMTQGQWLRMNDNNPAPIPSEQN